MAGRNWFWAALAAAVLACAGVAACSGGGDDDKGEGKGGTGGTGGAGGTGGVGGTGYDPAVDCAPICARMVEGCFHRGTEAECVAACAAATTAKNVLLACGACVGDSACEEIGANCFDTGKPCSTGGLFDLSVKGSGFAEFEDKTVVAALVEGGCTVADEKTGMVSVGAFGIRFPGALKEGRSYRVDYYVDLDGNNACDATDAVGTEELGYAEEAVTVNVTPGASEPRGCKAWSPGPECQGTGPTVDQAVCQALAECCESPGSSMNSYRQVCRDTAGTDNPAQCEEKLNFFVGKGWCAPSVDCQKLKVCCDSTDFAELSVGCELATTSASEETCTALLASYVGAGYCE